MKRIILLIIILTTVYSFSDAQKISEWRPENRTGVSAETGLLKSWPADGPALLWSTLELAKGFSSPVFGNGTIYITGLIGTEDALFALDMSGKVLWKTTIGRSWNQSFPDSRSTPTVEGNRVYASSGFGDIACADATSGKIIWSYKGSEVNKGTYGSWGIAEGLLIDGNKVFFSPGGPETMTIALNKENGNVIWKSASLGDKPGYVSPIVVNYAGKKMFINVSLGHVYGIDASNGSIMWSVAHTPADDGDDLIKCVTPLYKDGRVYVTGGYDTEGMMVEIAKDGKSAKVLWTDKLLDVHHGGAVLIDGYIYGSNWINNGNGDWCCIDWNTGEKKWVEHWNCKGSIISAEGMLYIYDEKQGNVGLIKVNPEKFDLVSSFKVTLGAAGPYWAHPVIHNRILYLRHGNALMAYDIKAK
jgi:outer membrane protein assembly factor BamB